MHEARAASALEHPNICTIHDIGETDDGQLFIVMTYYEGTTLKSKVESAPLPIDESISIIMQIASGLSKAHDKGIIHRDIKPDNIMMTKRNEIKLLDFGLAKLAGQTQVTMEGTTLGTAAYMSPEQARGEIVDQRSDIFSLSVIFYQLLTGHHPFEAEHQLATMYAIINEKPTPIRQHNLDIPEALAAIVEKGMAKELNQRYASLHQMISDLQNLSDKSHIEDEKRDKTPQKNKLIIPIIVFFALIIAIALIYSLGQKNETQDQMSQLYTEQAISSMEKGDQDAAEIALMRALELNSEDASTWNTLAALHIRMGKLEEAVEESKRAIELNQNFSSAYYNLAFALEEQGQDQEAKGNYALAIQKDSLFTPAYSALGSLYLKQNQPQAALYILEQAGQRSPDSKYAYLIWKNIGKAYYQLGDPQHAVSVLERSIKVQPFIVAETYYYLSLSLERLGKLTESRKYLETYIQHESDEKKRQAAEQKLDRQGK